MSEEKAIFARHLAFGLGAVEIFLGVCLLALVGFIGAAVSTPNETGAAIVFGSVVVAIALPATATMLALRAKKSRVVYACLLLLIAYPVLAISAYSIYG